MDLLAALFSQEIIVAQIELLLQYCNGFYNRQFITRKPANTALLTRLESLLHEYFNDAQRLASGLPTVQYVAGELNV